MKKTVVNFTSKDWKAILVISVILILFSVFQLIMSFLNPMRFSLYFFWSTYFSKVAKEILSCVILGTFIIMIILLNFKMHYIKKRKIYLKNRPLLFSVFIFWFLLFFLLPSAMPMNFVSPVILLFSYLIYR